MNNAPSAQQRTEFEQQVAAALTAVLGGELSFTVERTGTITDFDALVLALAPRVAAAIEGAINIHGHDQRWEEGHRAALGALRGDVAQGTSP